MSDKNALSHEKYRLKQLLWLMIQKYQPICYLSGKPFTYAEIFPSRGSDNLTEHHIDCNHYNNNLANRTLAYRTAHKAYHTKDNIHKKQSHVTGADLRKRMEG
jgi:hypothetical protein